MNTRIETKTVVGLSLFTAIVVVLQLLGSFIRFGTFSVSLVLLPIVVGAALYGSLSGAWLGLVFGAAVLLSGDAAAFLAVDPLGTVLTVLLKGLLAGWAAGLVYRGLQGKNRGMAVIAAAVTCPLVNTGIFLLGCQLFFMDTVSAMAQSMGFGTDVGRFIFAGTGGRKFPV